MDWVTGIQRAIDYIEDNITEKLSIEAIASQAYVSSFYFQRVFAIFCNCTVGEYIRNRRIALAGAEVSSSGVKIIDIAMKYGYENHESFTRSFVRFHGVTPSVARRDPSKLQSFNRISVKNILEGGSYLMRDFNERGYVVKETGPVYYTKDMDRTLKWFAETLGWYGEIVERDAEGVGLYGCTFNLPREIEALRIAPFTGIHLFHGEPQNNMVAFMMVTGIDALYGFVKKNGWDQITEVREEPWGSKTCCVTTIDGSILRFFE